MLPFNRRRSPSPVPRGFWEGRGCNNRPSYDHEFLVTQGLPQDYEYHNPQRFDNRRHEYDVDKQYYMRREPSPPRDRRQTNHTDHHDENAEFYDNLAAYIKHKIHESREIASIPYIHRDDRHDRPPYHNHVRSRDYDRFNERPIDRDFYNDRGYEEYRDYAAGQSYESRRSDYDQGRRHDDRGCLYYDEYENRGLLGDHPRDYDMGGYSDQFSPPGAGLPRRNSGSFPRDRRSSGDRPPYSGQRRLPTRRSHSNSRSPRGNVSPPQKRKMPMHELNAKKTRQNEQKPGKNDQERKSLLTRIDLLARDISSPGTTKNSVSQETKPLRDLREEINESRASSQSSQEIHVNHLKQQDLRYDINKSRADRGNSPSLGVTPGQCVLLHDQRKLRDTRAPNSPSTELEPTLSQPKTKPENSTRKPKKTETTTTVKKQLCINEENLAVAPKTNCETFIRKVEFSGGQPTTEITMAEATVKKPINKEEHATMLSKKNCETSIRKVKVCGAHSRSCSPSPRVVDKPPQELPCDDLRLLILSRRQMNTEEEYDSTPLAPCKKQRTGENTEHTKGTSERVVEVSVPASNTDKSVSNKVVDKEQTKSSRTVKKPRRKQKKNKAKANITTAKKPVARKVGLAKEKSDKPNEKVPKQSEACIGKKDSSPIPDQTNDGDLSNSLNYSLISDVSTCSNSDEKLLSATMNPATEHLVSDPSAIEKKDTSQILDQENGNDTPSSLNNSLITDDSNCGNSHEKEQSTTFLANKSTNSESSDYTRSSISTSSTNLDTCSTSSTSSNSKHDKSSGSPYSTSDTSTSTSTTSSNTTTDNNSKSTEADDTKKTGPDKTVYNSISAENSKLMALRKRAGLKKSILLSPNATKPSIDFTGDFIPLSFTDNETLDGENTKVDFSVDSTTLRQSTPLKKNCTWIMENVLPEFSKNAMKQYQGVGNPPKRHEDLFEVSKHPENVRKINEQATASGQDEICRYAETKSPQDIPKKNTVLSEIIMSHGSDIKNAKQISEFPQSTMSHDPANENPQKMPEHLPEISKNLKQHDFDNENALHKRASDQNCTDNHRDISVNSSSSSEYDPAFPTKSESMKGGNSSIEQNTSSEYDPAVGTFGSDEDTHMKIKNDDKKSQQGIPSFCETQNSVPEDEKNKKVRVSKKVASDLSSYEPCNFERNPTIIIFDSVDKIEDRNEGKSGENITETEQLRPSPENQSFLDYGEICDSIPNEKSSCETAKVYDPDLLTSDLSHHEDKVPVVKQKSSRNVSVEESSDFESTDNSSSVKTCSLAAVPSNEQDEREDCSLQDVNHDTTQENEISENGKVQTKLNQQLFVNCKYSVDDSSQNNQKKVMAVETSSEYILLQVDSSVNAKNCKDYSFIAKTSTDDHLPEKVLDVSVFEADEAFESPDKPESCRGLADLRSINFTQDTDPTDPFNVSDEITSRCSVHLTETPSDQLSTHQSESIAAENYAQPVEVLDVQQSTSQSELLQAPKPSSFHDLFGVSSNDTSKTSKSSLDEKLETPIYCNIHKLFDDSSGNLELTKTSDLHHIFDDSSNDGVRIYESSLADNCAAEADYNHVCSHSGVPQHKDRTLINQSDKIAGNDNRSAVNDNLSDTNLSDFIDDVGNHSSNSSETRKGDSHIGDDNEEALWCLSLIREDKNVPLIEHSEALSDNKMANPISDHDLQVIGLTDKEDRPNTTCEDVQGPSSQPPRDCVEITSCDNETGQSQTSATCIQNGPELELQKSSETDGNENLFSPCESESSNLSVVKHKTPLKDSSIFGSNSRSSLAASSLTNGDQLTRCTFVGNNNSSVSRELIEIKADTNMPHNDESISSLALMTSCNEADTEVLTEISSPDFPPKILPLMELDLMDTFEKCSEKRPAASDKRALDSSTKLINASESIYEQRMRKRKAVSSFSKNYQSQAGHNQIQNSKVIPSSSGFDEVYSPGNFLPLDQTPKADFSDSDSKNPSKKRQVLLPKGKSAKASTLDSEIDEVYSPQSFVPCELRRSSHGKKQRIANKRPQRRRHLSQCKRSDHSHSKGSLKEKKENGSKHCNKSDVNPACSRATKLQTSGKSLKGTYVKDSKQRSDRPFKSCLDVENTNELLLNEGQDLLELALEESLKNNVASSQAKQNSGKELESSKQSFKNEAESVKVDDKENKDCKSCNSFSASLVQRGVVDEVHGSNDEDKCQDRKIIKDQSSNESKCLQEHIKEIATNTLEKTSEIKSHESNSLDTASRECQNAVGSPGTTVTSNSSNVMDTVSNDINVRADVRPDSLQTKSEVSDTEQTDKLRELDTRTLDKNIDPTTCTVMSENSKVCEGEQHHLADAPVDDNSKVLQISLGDYIDAQLKNKIESNEYSPLKHNVVAPSTISKPFPMVTSTIKIQQCSPQLPDLELPSLESNIPKENIKTKANKFPGFCPDSLSSQESLYCKENLVSNMESSESFSELITSEGSLKVTRKHWQNVEFANPKVVPSKKIANFNSKQCTNLESVSSKPIAAEKSSKALSSSAEQPCPPFSKDLLSKESQHTLSKTSSDLETPSHKTVPSDAAPVIEHNLPNLDRGVVITTPMVGAREAVDERDNAFKTVCHEKVIAILRKRVDIEKVYRKECKTALNAVKEFARDKKATRKELEDMLQTRLTAISQKYISELRSFVRYTTG